MLLECVMAALLASVLCGHERILLESDPQLDAVTGSAALPSPQGVTVQSLNTQYLLKWAWPHRTTRNQTVTFTAQYISKYKFRYKAKQWITVCENITDTQCDFTDKSIYYFGIYLLRVRAYHGEESSSWVQQEFCPDKDANLGPPSKVEVTPVDNGLTVNISDPLSSTNTSMRDFHKNMYYSIQYWKHMTAESKDVVYFNATRNVVTLLNLDGWTVYCLRVQSRYDFYHKASNFSLPECVQTRGSTPLWQIFLFFLLSTVLCFACILLPSYAILKMYRLIKHIFFPSCQIPFSLQENLYDSSPSSDHPSLLTLDSEVEVCLQKLEMSPEEAHLEVYAINEVDAGDLKDSHHSRHNSRDSGVYSSEDHSGCSDHQQEPAKVMGREVKVLLNSGVVIHSSAGGCIWDCSAPVPKVGMSQQVLNAKS
ncbi:interferon alpha/beta receptor 1b-like isoform X2 [Arapaima gigas]